MLDNFFMLNSWDDLLSDHLDLFINRHFDVLYDFYFHYLLLNYRNLHLPNNLLNLLHFHDSINNSLNYLRNFHYLFYDSRHDYYLFHDFLYLNDLWNFY